MRIGEVLLREGWIYEDELESAIADQRVVGRRLCSMLVLRGHLEPDQAARALAEQHGVSAALAKHLENRERSLAKLLPPNTARQLGALPLGRMRDGEIVVCVRDPRPELASVFERILHAPVLITVAAACSLDPLIDIAYPPDFGNFARPSSQPTLRNDPPAPIAFAAGTETAGNGVAEEFDIDLDSGSIRPVAEPTFDLVSLDDAGVDKDFSMPDMKTPVPLPPGAGAPPRPSTLPPANVTRAPAKK